ncbi:MAG TPA: bifunctional class I SAM-dependent methyltransferase/glycosyltransferase family 2 protein [Candidatus Nanoarchaeia archaeon]|nr:bifunctional class I SAM-dependent methyltransferase/glycosyltransferase family 2 protein [Candidatus Nanoarchaeia archaeon]
MPIDDLSWKKREIVSAHRKNAEFRKKWIKKNRYYYRYILKLLKNIVEPKKRVLLLKSDLGDFLQGVDPSYGLGLEYGEELVRIAKQKYPYLNFEVADFERLEKIKEKFDYILLVNVLDDIVDVLKLFKEVCRIADDRTRIVIINHSSLWYPIVKIAEGLKLKMKQPTLNWLSVEDVSNLLYLADLDVVRKDRALLMPKYVPLVSSLTNKYIARIPGMRGLGYLQVVIARKVTERKNGKNFSVSIVIPCKNEKGNIENAIKRIPELGKWTEIIFGDDKSTDDTREEVLRCIKTYPNRKIRLVDSPGICKSKNVWECFKHASGDVLMILDADLTVLPEELPYFFNALMEGKGEFINGSRMVYPMEDQAMRGFNMIGNKMFGMIFSYLLDRPVKDTLCGTKVFFKEDYERMRKVFFTWGVEDQWGDYELLFSASKINLKIVDMPVHYVERTYGETKMNKRVKNGLTMLRMCLAASRKLKFI